MFSELNQPYTHKVDALNIKPASRRLFVSIENQTLDLIEMDQLTRSFQISSSLKPPSNQKDSFGTPRGLHRIAQKIGDGAPLGEVFKGRVSIGKRYSELPESDLKQNLITTRILWLEGMEPGYNKGEDCDSFDRYIYIHGTNHEDRVGMPSSGGCIQLRNAEMIELFNSVQLGDHVFID